MTTEQAIAIIGSIPEGREALQLLIDENGWYTEDPTMVDFLSDKV